MKVTDTSTCPYGPHRKTAMRTLRQWRPLGFEFRLGSTQNYPALVEGDWRDEKRLIGRYKRE